MMNYVDNFLIGTITAIMIGALFTDSGGHLKIEYFIGLLLILEKVLLTIIVLIGYATVAGIFIYLLRERLVKAKSVILSHIKSIRIKSKASTVVTHSEVSLNHDQSIVQSTELALQDLEESHNSALELENVGLPPIIFQERERFAKLRESLLES